MYTLNGRTQDSEVQRAGIASEGLLPLVFLEYFFDFSDWPSKLHPHLTISKTIGPCT